MKRIRILKVESTTKFDAEAVEHMLTLMTERYRGVKFKVTEIKNHLTEAYLTHSLKEALDEKDKEIDRLKTWIKSVAETCKSPYDTNQSCREIYTKEERNKDGQELWCFGCQARELLENG
jgi:type II secretory pathway predicted ATPase ExeA